MSEPGEITQLLNDWVGGDDVALSLVTPLIYDELKKIARQVFSHESPGHTLQPTALVHEAYVKLIGIDGEWQNRAHFYALAARLMRRLLVNHANARSAKKRGGDVLKVTLHDDVVGDTSGDEGVLELNMALEELADIDERKAATLELHYFGGLTHDQIATALSISESTVRRELRAGKAWLRKLMSDGNIAV